MCLRWQIIISTTSTTTIITTIIDATILYHATQISTDILQAPFFKDRVIDSTDENSSFMPMTTYVCTPLFVSTLTIKANCNLVNIALEGILRLPSYNEKN